jgi:hypothetical protein
MTGKHIIGTRIRFTKRLDAGPNEDHPAIVYAERDSTGAIVSYAAKEGYWVWSTTNGRDKPFGASEDEFELERPGALIAAEIDRLGRAVK